MPSPSSCLIKPFIHPPHHPLDRPRINAALPRKRQTHLRLHLHAPQRALEHTLSILLHLPAAAAAVLASIDRVLHLGEVVAEVIRRTAPITTTTAALLRITVVEVHIHRHPARKSPRSSRTLLGL